MDKLPVYYYRIIIGDSPESFQIINENLRRLGVQAEYKQGLFHHKSDRVYRLKPDQIKSLPMDLDTQEHYIPKNAEEGWAIFPNYDSDNLDIFLPDKYWEPWKPIQ